MGRYLIGGLTVGLVGPLGSGKTLFVQGLAAGNAPEASPEVTSPTFTLIHEYRGRLVLYHLDVYRLKQAAELVHIGFDELARPDSVVVIEWADRVASLMPDDALWIEIDPTEATSRRITCRSRHALASRMLPPLH